MFCLSILPWMYLYSALMPRHVFSGVVFRKERRDHATSHSLLEILVEKKRKATCHILFDVLISECGKVSCLLLAGSVILYPFALVS